MALWIAWAVIVYVLPTQSYGAVDPISINGERDKSVTLQCNHKNKPGISVITWHFKDENDPVVKYNTLDSNMIVDTRFEGRVKLDPTSGDLTLSHLTTNDEGDFQCVAVANGLVDTAQKYTLTIIVVPAKITVLCSDHKDVDPSKACDDIEADKITAISFAANAKPNADIKLIDKPDNCKTHELQMPKCSVEADRTTTCSITVSKVCDGKYASIATFLPQPDLVVKSAAITVGKGTGGASVPIVVVVIVIVFLLLVAAGVAIAVIYFRKRKSAKPPEDAEAAEKVRLKEGNNEASPDKANEPYEGDLVNIASKVSTNEKKDEDSNNMQIARQDSITERRENEDPFMEGGLDLREDNNGPSEDRNKQIRPAYMANPAKMSMHTRSFLGAGGNMAPNTKMKYVKEEPDGTKRIFEIEKLNDPVVHMTERKVEPQSPIIELPEESENEDSMTSKTLP